MWTIAGQELKCSVLFLYIVIPLQLPRWCHCLAFSNNVFEKRNKKPRIKPVKWETQFPLCFIILFSKINAGDILSCPLKTLKKTHGNKLHTKPMVNEVWTNYIIKHKAILINEMLHYELLTVMADWWSHRDQFRLLMKMICWAFCALLKMTNMKHCTHIPNHSCWRE